MTSSPPPLPPAAWTPRAPLVGNDGLRLPASAFPEGFAPAAPLVVAAGAVLVPWTLALWLLDGTPAVQAFLDGAGPLPTCLPKATRDDLEAVAAALAGAPVPPRTGLRLELTAAGLLSQPARCELRVRASRFGAPETLPPLEVPRFDTPRGPERLSLPQWLVLDRTRAVPKTDENSLRWHVARLIGDLEALHGGPLPESVDVEGVRVSSYLLREQPLLVDDVSLDLAPVGGGGFQVRPRAAGVAPEALEGWYFGRTEAGAGLRLGGGGARRMVVFSERARNAVAQLKRLNVLPPEAVARLLDDPQAMLGPDVDLGAFSPRVRGLGLIEPEAGRGGSDVQVGGWFEFTRGDGSEGGLRCDLRDLATNRAFVDAITAARARGLGWFLHPLDPTLFVPITARLEALLRAALAPPPPPPAPKLGLQIVETQDAATNLAADLGLGALLPLPDDLPLGGAFRLKPHQDLGARWLLSLACRDAPRERGGALLADDMGLGKTLQVLVFLAALHARGRGGPHLVVAPVGLLEGWSREAARAFGRLFDNVRVVSGGLARDGRPLGRAQLTLVSYESLKLNELAFARVAWDVVILDEAQRIKNAGTDTRRVACALEGRFRLAMTGTPVENALRDLWSLMDWATPGLLGSADQFERTFGRARSSQAPLFGEEPAAHLLRQLRPHFLRRLKADVLADVLPPIAHARHDVPLDATQLAAYRATLADKDRGRLEPLAAVRHLLDVCAHPHCRELDVTPTRQLTPFPKADALLSLLHDIASRGEKVLIFANRRPIQHWLAALVTNAFGLVPPIINGEVAESEQRMRIIDRFSQRGGFGVLILAPRAAGVGLTITAANHVIHYQREWNPAIEAQATDRSHRIGQTRPVTVHTLTATAPGAGQTVEQRLDRLLVEKQRLIRAWVVPTGVPDITVAELLGG